MMHNCPIKGYSDMIVLKHDTVVITNSLGVLMGRNQERRLYIKVWHCSECFKTKIASYWDEGDGNLIDVKSGRPYSDDDFC